MRITKIDPVTNRVSASVKALTDDPYEDIEKKYKVGEIYDGVCTKLMQYGVFLRLQEGVEGLIHNSELSWTNKNISEHPKFYNSDVKDNLTDIGSFFDINNKYNDKTTPSTVSLPSDKCFIDKMGNQFCEENTRLQNIPPRLISDPENKVLNTIGFYKDNNIISDMKDKIINGGIFYDNIKGSKEKNEIYSHFNNNPLIVDINY